MRADHAEEMQIIMEKDWKIRWQKKFEKYNIEILLMIIFAMCGLNFVIGKYSNN